MAEFHKYSIYNLQYSIQMLLSVPVLFFLISTAQISFAQSWHTVRWVNDGDTIVIGGIIKSNIQDSTTGWPGLKDIPLLGWLFKSNSQSDTANEILIFITPRIVLLEQAQVS